MEPKIKISPLAAIFVVIQIMVIIVVASLLINLNQSEEIDEQDVARQPKLVVEGLEDAGFSLPESSLQEIEKGLLGIAKYNNQNIDTLVATGKVRPESLKTIRFEDQDLYFVSAVIDIPELKQSYQVFHDFTKTDANPYYNAYFATIAVCSSGIVENIYEDFECQDMHDKKIYGEVVKKYLNYLKFEGFNVDFIDDSLNTLQIFMANPTADEATRKIAVKRVKEQIESLGIPGDHFTYDVVDISSLNFEKH
ncbi:hypothetical protein J5491_00240 [Candidatus Saccharibacteria bacterium]|nr:hypothetical protein [Candidatus Saccharibacteria bacterium]